MFFTGPVVISLFHIKTMKQTMRSGVMGMGIGKITTQKGSHCSHQDSAIFLKCSLNCCKSLTNFQNSEKVDLTTFASVPIYFMEEWIFRDLYSLIPELLSLGTSKIFIF